MTAENTTREFWVRAPGKGEIRQGLLPPLGAEEVRVRTLFSGISRGTESLVFRGEVPDSQRDAMRCPFQEGDVPGPVKYGYMSVGRVELGQGASPTLQGTTVFCLHPHQDRYVVPATAIVPVPEGVPTRRAVLAANMETAVNGLWDARIGVGDRVVVIGAGVVGLLVAWLASRIPGVEVTAVDPNPARRGVAEALDVPYAPHAPLDGRADVVVHASGNPQGLRDALQSAGAESRIVEMSWYGTRQVQLPLGEAFHARRISIASSQVGHIPPWQSPRWTHRRRMELALRLLRAPELDALITGESPFTDLPAVMERLSVGGDDTLCHLIRYDG